ncbi:MAG: hypothetical protein CM15mP74_32270 [Halieaceae bacterium]|nr:MAG: hypothetical protein CM15mP74_32270 [Halieaceae bacterium]
MERGHGFRALQEKGIRCLSAWRTFYRYYVVCPAGWVPTLLIRVHGMDIADAGRGYGSIALLCGSAGVLSGPVLAKYFTRKGHKDAGLRVATLAAAALLPAIVLQGLPPNHFGIGGHRRLQFFCHRADGAFYNRFAGGHAKRDARL